MRAEKSQLDLDEVAREIQSLRPEFWRDGSGALMLFRPCEAVPPWLGGFPAILDAIDEINWIQEAAALYVMVNILPPGTVVPVHTDTLVGGRRVERWHLPVTTNERCLFWDRNFGSTRMHLGSWWGPVPYWLDHSVENTGTTERVHLVVDLDKDVTISPV